MKIKRNKYFPFKGFEAMNWFGTLLARPGVIISERTIRHELIHTEQMKELWYVFFYLWYGIEWFLKLFIYFNADKAYKAIGFEREAYANQDKIDYRFNRKKFAFIHYRFKPK